MLRITLDTSVERRVSELGASTLRAQTTRTHPHHVLVIPQPYCFCNRLQMHCRTPKVLWNGEEAQRTVRTDGQLKMKRSKCKAWRKITPWLQGIYGTWPKLLHENRKITVQWTVGLGNICVTTEYAPKKIFSGHLSHKTKVRGWVGWPSDVPQVMTARRGGCGARMALLFRVGVGPTNRTG